MKDTLSAKKWIALFLALTLLMLSALAGIAYAVDPYFQYRVKDNTYFLSSSYVNAGLIKNYDYDTIILGSSMVSNYDMDQFREQLNHTPVKIEYGGMSPKTIAAFLNYAAQVGKASQYYVNIDISSFQTEGFIANEHLLKNDLVSKAKYLLGYETWFRFIPVDCGLMLYKAVFGPFPPGKLAQRTSIDQNGAWTLGIPFGRDVVLYNRAQDLYSVSEVNLNNLYERMLSQIDTFLSRVDFQAGSYTFIFPPYSALYWCDAQDQGYFDTFLEAKKYFVQELLNRGCTVYDFQSAELTIDLDNYQDSTHYSGDVNVWMTTCFTNGTYQVTPDNYAALQEQLIENTIAFRTENASLFQ